MFVQVDFGAPTSGLVVVTIERGRLYRPTADAAQRPSWTVERLEVGACGDFGPRLKAARQARGLSLSEAAERLLVSPFELSCLERGLTMPEGRVPGLILELLGVAADGSGCVRSRSEIHVSTRQEVIGALAAASLGHFLGSEPPASPRRRRHFCCGDRCPGLEWPANLMTHPITCVSDEWRDTWPVSTSSEGPIARDTCPLCHCGWIVEPGCPACDHPAVEVLGRRAAGWPMVPLPNVDLYFAAGWRGLVELPGRIAACPACGANEETAIGEWRGVICPACDGQGVV